VLVLKYLQTECTNHICNLLPEAIVCPKEVMEYELQLGDRKTFLGEESIRILERILGIERDYLP
jgi:hypothetical protein